MNKRQKAYGLTGNMCKAVRSGFGLSARTFGDSLGVDPATVWRWEAFGASPLCIDNHTVSILVLLARRLPHLTGPQRERIASKVRTALAAEHRLESIRESRLRALSVWIDEVLP